MCQLRVAFTSCTITGAAVPGAFSGTLKSASVFLGADTPIGPLYFGYGHTADGTGSWYLFLGRP